MPRAEHHGAAIGAGPTLRGMVGGMVGGRVRGLVRAHVPAQWRARLVRPPRWMIGVTETDDPLAPTAAGPPRPVLPQSTLDDLGLAFVADPFAVHRDGRWFVFFEAVRRGERRGQIAVATSDDLREWRYEGVVLAEPFHLSYPALIDDDGEAVLAPESAEDRSLRLYRSDDFPFGWRRDRVLLRGRAFKDSTLLRDGGHSYLFTETSDGFTNDELRLFAAANLTGPWVEHPCSPLVVDDADAARPAGALLRLGPRLVRLSQCCTHRYGFAVRAHEITELSPTAYRERPLPGTVVTGSGRDWHAAAMHHVDAHHVDGRWVVFVDGHA